MTEREYFLAWGVVQNLVDDALGLALLGEFDSASNIIDAKNQQLASASLVGASVVLLKQAQTLLESMDPHGFTFKAKGAAQS